MDSSTNKKYYSGPQLSAHQFLELWTLNWGLQSSNHFRCKFQSFHSVPAAGFNLLQFGESSRPSDSIFSYSLYFECKRSWFEKSSKQHVSRDKQRAGARKLLNRKEVRYVAVRVRRVSLAKMQFPAIKFTRVRFRRVYATHTHTHTAHGSHVETLVESQTTEKFIGRVHCTSC